MAAIKICGLSRQEDIAAVNEAGPEYCGFIIDFPQSHRNVTEEQVRQLRTSLKPGITPVGVIVNQSVMRAAELLNQGIVDVIQLHGQEDEEYIQQLRVLMKNVDAKEDSEIDADAKEYTEINIEGGMKRNNDQKGQIWKAFKIRCREDLEKALASSADAIVLDNGYGTGETFDWSILDDAGARLKEKKIFLAGGLTPENIEDAIHRLDVWGIDISSGVETDKKKDRKKILAAVQAARRTGGDKQ